MRTAVATILLLLAGLAAPPRAVAGDSYMVLVRPLEIRSQGVPDWFGRSIADALDTEARAAGLMPAKEPVLISPPLDPLRSLASRGIAVLIDGVCDSDGHTLQVRVTVRSTHTQQPLAQLSALGSHHELLRIKDSLVSQFREAFARVAATPPAALTPPTALAPQPPAPIPGQTFDSSRLRESMHDRHQQAVYDSLYFQDTRRPRSRYPLTLPGLIYPGAYYPPPLVVYPPPPIMRRHGFTFDAHYQSDKWHIDFSGGAARW